MKERREFLGGIFAGVRQPVLQDESRHALAVSHFATSVPSLVIESAMKPPPGQMTAAVPLFLRRDGLKTVSDGLVTLVTTSVFQSFEKYAFSG